MFLRSEAIELGFDDNTLQRAVRSGLITRVRHGCYTFSDVWGALSAEDKHVLLGRAAVRRLGGVALSHTTAALAHGMAVWDVNLTRAHVTRIDAGAGRRERDLIHHEGVTDEGSLTQVAGVPTTTAVRAALETATLVGLERGLVTACSGLRLGLYTPADLSRQHDSMREWPGARSLHLVTRLSDAAYESVGEVRAAHLFWTEALPRPVPQFEVYDETGRLIARVDFAWPEQKLAVEFDGKGKYQQHLRPGETPADAVVREKLREDALRAAGWAVIRIGWADLYRPKEIALRIRRQLRTAA